MLTLEQKTEIKNAIVSYAEKRAGDIKYAYAFGMLWGTLTEKQIKLLAEIVKEG